MATLVLRNTKGSPLTNQELDDNFTNLNNAIASAGSGTVIAVTGTSPVSSSGGTSPAISLAANYGDTQNPYASKTANYFLAAPNGTAGVPTFRAIVVADIPTLNQNTTGTAASITGTYSGSLTSSQVTTALGFTPYNSTNPTGYITGITSANVTTALGFTPYNATNPSNYISSITSANVTTALGFTPVSASSTDTLTNKRIQPRVLSAASSTTFSVNADSYDVAEMIMTGVAGTLAIGNPTGTPVNGQKLIYKLQCTNAQTYNWGTIFQGSTDLALPTSCSGASKWDYYGFIYNSTAAKWQLVAKMAGF